MNEIILGDCLEKMKDIPDGSVDMILTDLPYGITACKWDCVIDFKELWKQWNRIKKESTPIILTAIQPFASLVITSNITNFNHEWIWEKTRHTNFLAMKYQPAKIHESVLVFGKGITYNPIKWYVDADKIDKRKNVNDPINNKDGYLGIIKRTRKKDDGSRFPKSIIKFKNVNSNTLHPTQKPVELFEYLIKTYTSKSDLVLDCCAGSGTTAIACMNTNRNYICIEKDETYFNIMKKRVENHSVNQTLDSMIEKECE